MLLLRSQVVPSIRTRTTSIPVQLARTTSELKQGLSGTSSLPVGTGMLFIFEHPGGYGFWMKDMQYPLDIVWMDENLRVVEITQHLTPETFPEVTYPQVPVKYVLELNADTAKQGGFVIGEKVKLRGY